MQVFLEIKRFKNKTLAVNFLRDDIMAKIIKFEGFIDELINLNKREIVLLMKKEIKQTFNDSKCKVIHNLSYKDNKELSYSFEHKNISINSLVQKTLAQLLYKDLTQILDKGQKLKSKGIDILLSLNGTGLPYLGHRDYLDDNGYLNMLSLPNLLLDMRNEYKLKQSPE